MINLPLRQIALTAALMAMASAVADPGFARGGRGGGGGGFRGGGVRSGGMSSMSRPSGGNFSRGGSGAYSRGGGTHVSTLPSGGARPGGGAGGQRPGGGGRPGGGEGAGGGQRPGGGERPSQLPSRGDINIGNGNDINIDGGWGDWNDHVNHPIAAGIAIGAVAGATAAAMGSWYYDLPYGCSPYPYAGYSYYSCGGYYLQPSYEGDTVVYVTVPDPKAGGQTEASAQPGPGAEPSANGETTAAPPPEPVSAPAPPEPAPPE